MKFHLHLNDANGRLHVRARGIWTVALAEAFRTDMGDVRHWARHYGRPISILTDLSGLSVHAQDVAPIVAEGAQQLIGLPVTGYGMIVPSALMRMQVRRIDPLQKRQLFDTVEEAAAWLGWDDFVAVDLDRPDAPVREVIVPALLPGHG